MKSFTSRLCREISDNKYLYAAVAALFVLGIFTGALYSSFSGADSGINSYFDRFVSAYLLQGAGHTEIFRLSLINYLLLAALLWISGLSPWFLPLGGIQLLIKGFKTGFTVAAMLQYYHFKGFLLALITILPQSIILIPSLCFFGVYQIKFAADRRAITCGRASAAVKRQIYTNNMLMTAAFLTALLFCSLIEGFIIPGLLKPVCGLLL